MSPKKTDPYKSNKQLNHTDISLYSEWPAPTDVVAGFGGNPDKADPRRWKRPNGTPNAK